MVNMVMMFDYSVTSYISLQALSRTYAQSIAGTGTEMIFNHLTNEFKLAYRLYESCTSNLTEVWLINAL